MLGHALFAKDSANRVLVGGAAIIAAASSMVRNEARRIPELNG